MKTKITHDEVPDPKMIHNSVHFKYHFDNVNECIETKTQQI